MSKTRRILEHEAAARAGAARRRRAGQVSLADQETIRKEREELRKNISKTMAVAGLRSSAYTNKALRLEVARDVGFCIDTELVPLAISVLRDTLNDKLAPIKERVKVAFGVLNRGGFPERPYVEAFASKEIEAMSRDELHDFVKTAEFKLSGMAKPVDDAQYSVIKPQVIDNIEG